MRRGNLVILPGGGDHSVISGTNNVICSGYMGSVEFFMGYSVTDEGTGYIYGNHSILGAEVLSPFVSSARMARIIILFSHVKCDTNGKNGDIICYVSMTKNGDTGHGANP